VHELLTGVPNGILKSFGHTRARLGRVRPTILARLATACPSEVNFDVLRQAAEPHCIANYTRLREALMDPRYTRFQLSLFRWIERHGWRMEAPTQALETLAEPALRQICSLIANGRFRSKADIARATRACRSVAIDPKRTLARYGTSTSGVLV
jgi:hypothetical protein